MTPLLFALGGLITAIFSGSLAVPARHADFQEVMITGMIVPSFTWVVQLSASGLCLCPPLRQRYWRDLGAICLLGSVALLPGAVVNLLVPDPPLWASVANVLASVVLMAVDLFRRSLRHRISLLWPISWCATITFNMALFAWVSRAWW